MTITGPTWLASWRNTLRRALNANIKNTPGYCLASIGIDFVSGMKKVHHYDSVFVVTDRLIKMAKFIPTKKTLYASECADLLINHIICNHGIPEEIVSDRDKLFTGKIWDRLRQRLRIQLKFTTSYNPASNGQTERTNDTMRKIIASYTNDHADDLPMYCAVAAFAYNNTYQGSIKTTPFFANYGFHPRLPGFTNRILQHHNNNEEEHTDSTLQSDLDYHLQALQNIMISIQTNMADAQDRQSIDFNKHHRPVDIKVGDRVLIHKDAYNNQTYTKFHHLRTNKRTVSIVESTHSTFDVSSCSTKESMPLMCLQNLTNTSYISSSLLFVPLQTAPVKFAVLMPKFGTPVFCP